jgi:hypothetical protein
MVRAQKETHLMLLCLRPDTKYEPVMKNFFFNKVALRTPTFLNVLYSKKEFQCI